MYHMSSFHPPNTRRKFLGNTFRGIQTVQIISGLHATRTHQNKRPVATSSCKAPGSYWNPLMVFSALIFHKKISQLPLLNQTPIPTLAAPGYAAVSQTTGMDKRDQGFDRKLVINQKLKYIDVEMKGVGQRSRWIYSILYIVDVGHREFISSDGFW